MSDANTLPDGAVIVIGPGAAPEAEGQFWANHPNAKQLALGTLNLFPAIGGTTGAIVGASGGPATAWGGGILGTMAGRGLRDPIAQWTGLDEHSDSPIQDTVGHMGVDAALTAIIPPVLDRAKSMVAAPKEHLADLLETLFHPKDAADEMVQFLRGQPLTAANTAATTAERTVVPRLAGTKAPTLEDALTATLKEAQQGPRPTEVSLSDVGSSRTPTAAVPGPGRLGAWSPITAEAEGGEAASGPRGGARLRAPMARMNGRLILTPEEVAAADQLKTALRPGASLEGMKSAARMKAGDTPASLNDLMKELERLKQ